MRYFHYLLIAMMIFLALCVGVFTYWNLEGIWFHKPLSQDSIYIHTDKLIYKPGETVRGTLNFCVNTSIIPVIQWSLADTFLRIYSPKQGNGEKKCYENVITDIEDLSTTLPPEKYHFSGTAVFQINPIREIIIPLSTNEFQVNE